MPFTAEQFRATHSGKMLVVGNSYSLDEIDLGKNRYPTVSCNRILRHASFVPTYLVMSDREAYIQERDAGRLGGYAGNGGRLLLSETIFDPEIKGRRADKDKTREYPAQPEPDFQWHSMRIGAWHTKPNFDSFDELLCSCANIFGPMLQAAVILGAREVGVVGVDMKWPKDRKSHFYGYGSEVGAFPFVSLPNILYLFKKMKRRLETMAIKVWNLSPERGTPFGGVFAQKDYASFISEEQPS
jgi:hypothetical protein